SPDAECSAHRPRAVEADSRDQRPGRVAHRVRRRSLTGSPYSGFALEAPGPGAAQFFRGRMAAAVTCRACGTEPLPNAPFGHGCGAAMAETPAEYKQVTVLFADVVHSMDIATAVGAERLREIMTELVNRAAVVVQRFGGTVDKFTGDGIMAVFGAPVAL